MHNQPKVRNVAGERQQRLAENDVIINITKNKKK
jgi:hypothetical protein